MKKEQRTLIISSVINIIVSTLKIIGGLLCGSYTLVASGYYSISDLITDILAIVGARIGKKKANKKYPFGYGKTEYKIQIAIGIVIILVGVYVAVRAFFLHFERPDLRVLYLCLGILLLKILSSNYLMKKGKELSSLMLITNAKESFLDVLSMFVVILIIIFSNILLILDLIGTLLIAILLIYEGARIIFDKLIMINGVDENNEAIKTKIKRLLIHNKKIKYSETFLIKNKDYYCATIEIGISKDLTVQELMLLEIELKERIKRKVSEVKYIDFNVIEE